MAIIARRGQGTRTMFVSRDAPLTASASAASRVGPRQQSPHLRPSLPRTPCTCATRGTERASSGGQGKGPISGRSGARDRAALARKTSPPASVEPIAGSTGICCPAKGLSANACRELCTQHGILLVSTRSSPASRRRAPLLRTRIKPDLHGHGREAITNGVQPVSRSPSIHLTRHDRRGSAEPEGGQRILPWLQHMVGASRRPPAAIATIDERHAYGGDSWKECSRWKDIPSPTFAATA